MRSFADLNILVYGDVMLDEYVEGVVERISPEAPVPIFVRGESTYHPGGAANVAMNLAALGCHVDLVGVAAGDRAHFMLASIFHDNIAFHAVEELGRDTTHKTRFTVNGQSIFRIDDEQTHEVGQEVADKLTNTLYNMCMLRRYDAIIVSDYAKGAVVGSAYDTLVAMGPPVFVDPKRADFSFYRGCQYIKPNLKELLHAEQTKNVERALTSVQIKTGAEVLLTLGAGGMMLTRKELPPFTEQAKVQEVIDVSGAGDTVIAVFAACIASGFVPAYAMYVANMAAGKVVKKRGTSVVTASELLGVTS